MAGGEAPPVPSQVITCRMEVSYEKNTCKITKQQSKKVENGVHFCVMPNHFPNLETSFVSTTFTIHHDNLNSRCIKIEQFYFVRVRLELLQSVTEHLKYC
jgi:hypothetical protein